MYTQTITPPAAKVVNAPREQIAASADQFSVIATCSGVIATEFSYSKEEEIYGEGEPSEYVYQVIRGAVRTYKLLNDGRRQIGAFYLPGDIFGLQSGPVHRLTAEAVSDTTVRLVKRRSLEQAAGITVQVAQSLWAMTAGELRHAEDHMLLLGRKNAMERVASFLLEMDRRLAKTGMMALPMCRRDIGDYLGLTLETVSRALSQLHNEGVLGFSGARQIVLRNRQRLHTMDA
jgi:CRP/FNR family transcriptional regulator, nitrogen fixation regulation protein